MSKWEDKMNFKDMKKKGERLNNLKGEKIRRFSNLEEMIIEDMNRLERTLLNRILEDQ